MKVTRKWIKPSDQKPDDDTIVDWLDSSGNLISLGRYYKGLWFLPGGEMYIYYTPTFWRYSW